MSSVGVSTKIAHSHRQPDTVPVLEARIPHNAKPKADFSFVLADGDSAVALVQLPGAEPGKWGMQLVSRDASGGWRYSQGSWATIVSFSSSETKPGSVARGRLFMLPRSRLS